MSHNHTTKCPIPDDLCAAYKEQKRIIKLINDRTSSMQNAFSGWDEAHRIIALIKGENK
jgi:hypothetical protein